MNDGMLVPDGGKAPASLERYGFGLLLSAALTLLLLWLDVDVLIHPDMGYGGIVPLMIAVFIGGPLAVMLLITWGVYMARFRGNLPGKVHLAMFVPPLLSLLVLPVADDIQQADARRFSDAHPVIAEVHVNLSGRPLWLALDDAGATSSGAWPQMPMKPAPWASFVGFVRRPGKDEVKAGTFPYAGAHLRDSVTTYAYAKGDACEQGKLSQRSLPLLRLPYPDLHQLTPYAAESALLVHQYFHYGDRVEVAPSLSTSAGDEELRGKVPNLVRFYLSNRVPPAIARLEADGQTLVLGDAGPITADIECRTPNMPVGYALVDLGRSLKLRWQTVDNPWQWHEANLTLPAFASAIRGAAASSPGVVLYFTGDDRVAAERFQLMQLEDGRRALLSTGRPADVPADKVCGSAADGYDDTVQRLH